MALKQRASVAEAYIGSFRTGLHSLNGRACFNGDRTLDVHLICQGIYLSALLGESGRWTVKEAPPPSPAPTGCSSQ